MSFCPKCGSPLKPEARFCGKCGSRVSIPEENKHQSSQTSLDCHTCGAKLTQYQKFCVLCGNNVQIEEKVAPASIDIESAFPAQKNINQNTRQKLPAGKRPKSLIIFTLLFALIALLAAGTWYYINYYQTTTDVVSGPEYTVHAVVSSKTTEEIKESSFKAGEEALLTLTDSCSVLITGLTCDAKAKFSKSDNTINTGAVGIETSGYMVSLSIQLSRNAIPPKPVITIPKTQVGSVNPATVNMLRIGDIMDSDGKVIHNQVQFLPVSLDENGNFTAIDYFFPLSAPSSSKSLTVSGSSNSGVLQMFFPGANAQNNPYNEQMAWVANVKYCIVSFQGHINWSKEPLLVEMTPDKRKSYFRHPATKQERLGRKQPIMNIIILVHGHNEEEKGGYVENNENGIWGFDYKRDVWNSIYQYYIEEQEKANKADANKPEDCTLFYEFIYPSFRPVFTPVPANSITRHQTLGENLGEALNKELLENNPQVAKMVKENIPFNLFIVGHSMGGLVARAGLRSLDLKLLANFRQLITWGSPHQGSPVTTLRYIAAAGYDISIDGLPFYPYGEYPAEIMKSLALDTPGTRDLRWTNGSKGFEKFFDYDKYFQGNSFTNRRKPENWDLKTGAALYNNNLKTFNESEKFASKYTFLTGNTTKIAQVKKCNFLLTKAYYLLVKASDCAKGSYIIRLLAGDDVYRDNDGASPVYGQSGQGLWPRPRMIDMGDMDHEEFYGDKGMETAARTFYIMRETASCNCPYIENVVQNAENITAKIVWPGVKNPAKTISKIEAELIDYETNKVVFNSSDFSFIDSQGNFKGTISKGKDNTGKPLQLSIKATTSSGSVIQYTINSTGGNKLKLNYSRVSVRIYLMGSYFAYSNWDGSGFKLDQNQMEQSQQNGLRDVGAEIRNENMFNTEWGTLPQLTWNGNNFTMQHTYQVLLNPAEARWDTFKISGNISEGSPRTVSGEAIYSMKNKLADGTDGFDETGIVFTNVPYNSNDEFRLIFSFSSKDSGLKNYVTKYWKKNGGGQFKTEVGNIDWNQGGDITVGFYNK